MNFKILASASVIALALTLAGAASAAENTATPSNTDGWSPANVRTAATVGITSTYKPSGETGSLEFTKGLSATGQDKADYVHGLSGTLGDLATNGSVSYNYLVNSTSTTAAHLAPAFRLDFQNTAGETGSLIWEPVYNGTTDVTNDAFVANDITSGNFWMHTSTGNFIEQYGVTLADWANGASFAGSDILGANTLITGVEIGIGSGWAGTFNGAVDHVKVDFGNGVGGVSTNFEMGGIGGVPEPASWALMILGFGGVGAAMRKRRSAAAFA